MAKSVKYTVNFLEAKEESLYRFVWLRPQAHIPSRRARQNISSVRRALQTFPLSVEPYKSVLVTEEKFVVFSHFKELKCNCLHVENNRQVELLQNAP